MADYDVLLIHPPAFYDFRKKPFFTGALGTSVEQVQFDKIPIGMLSIAEYLDRHGYKVLVDNLGSRMVSSQAFDAEEYLKKTSARVFAIGLHFQQHSQGAIETARLCKQFHPGSLVIMGGLTATCFHEEIIRKYEFVDAVIRGEAEKPFLQFLRNLEKHGHIAETPNLTYRTDGGDIMVVPLMPPDEDLDEYEYTRFDLLDPQTSIFTPGSLPRWSLEVCRGCVYNCSICGGSAYAYKTRLGRGKPAFRSPDRIVKDIKKLSEQGIRSVGLYQDPRMGGKKYWQELLAALRREKPGIDRLSLDLLAPAGEEFIRGVAEIGKPVTLHICPDTGSDEVRRMLGRRYSTEALVRTVKLCHQHLIPVTSFFSVGLAGETRETVTKTWELWDRISSLEQIMNTRGRALGLGDSVPLGGPILGPIVLDPGSLAFDFPEKYGYKLLYKTLEEYIRGLSGPSWHHWLNYETSLLKKEEIIEIILQSTAFSIEQREACGFYNHIQADAERRRLRGDIIALKEVDRIMGLPDPAERESRLKDLRTKLDSFLNPS
jgi:B12-binding domain/radical SAM domain protein